MNWDAPAPEACMYSSGVYLGDRPVVVRLVPAPLSLGGAVRMLAEALPPTEGRWAAVVEALGETVVGFTWRSKLAWKGTAVGFDELTRHWFADDVAWWATMAEHIDLQDGGDMLCP